MTTSHHSMKTVARLTGLSPHLIRIWEKRYNAVSPRRTASNRRCYSDDEVERLNLLRQATAVGHSIGNIATLPLERLKALVAKAELSQPDLSPTGRSPASPAQAFHDSCVAAVKRFDAHLLNETLQKAVVALGHQGLLRQVIGPLAQTIGELWRTGVATAAHEHFLTAQTKIFVGLLTGRFAFPANAPRLVVATPVGQLHELGAVIVSDTAAQIGWRPIYLGPNLPAAEIAGAAIRNEAAAIALSIVYPEDDPDLPQELTNLRRFLPNEIKVLVGGRAAAAYTETLSRIGALLAKDIDEFSNQLDALRHSGNRTSG
jgi:MerR family transcriptional regulator, light-induced transcriptional regulator